MRTAAALQRTAGNAAVGTALRAARPVVQRQLMLTGAPADVQRVLSLLQAASGLTLRHDRATDLVTIDGKAGTPKSPALSAVLGTIVGDTTRVATVKLTRIGDGIFMGQFPEKEDDRTQLVRIDQILGLEQGVGGAGVATLAHELHENYKAQAVPADPWRFAFGGPHETALQSENAILAELQDAAGAPRSGDRFNTYPVAVTVPPPRRGGPAGLRILQVATYANEYIVHEEVTDAGGKAMRSKRVPTTTLGTFTLSGFSASTNDLPKGADATLERVAKLLDANRTAGVVMFQQATSRDHRGAGRWVGRVTDRIRDLMSGDAEVTTERRFGTDAANEITITVRRPTAR